MCMGCCTLAELNYHNGVNVGNRFVTTSFYPISLSRAKCVDPPLVDRFGSFVASPCVGVRN